VVDTPGNKSAIRGNRREIDNLAITLTGAYKMKPLGKYLAIWLLLLLCIGVASAVPAYDSNTKYQLHLNGTYNSTVFTDDVGHIFAGSGVAHINNSANASSSILGNGVGFFNGGTGYISTPDSADLDHGTGSFTYEYRVNNTFVYTPLQYEAGYIIRYNGAGGYLFIYNDANNGLTFNFNGARALYYLGAAGTTTAFPAKTWVNVAIVGDRGNNTMRLYINGVNKAWTEAIAINGDLSATSEMNIGGNPATGRMMQGFMDEIRISNIARYSNDYTPLTTEWGGGNGGAGAPIANFTAAPTDMMYGATLQLNDTSTNSPTTWNYSFLDGVGTKTWSNGTTLAYQNLTRIMNSGGHYTIQLWAQNANGGNYSDKQIVIDVWNWSPTTMSGTPLSGANPLTVTFTGSSNNATTYYWEFGDTGTSASQSPTHQYISNGVFNVNYGTKNAHHDYNWTNNTGYIQVNVTLLADFSGTPTSGILNPTLPVNFVDMSTGDGLYAWTWDFGDTGASTLRNPSHSYTTAGAYNVKLTTSGSDGTVSTTKNNYITVLPNSTGNTGFIIAHTLGRAPNYVLVTGSVPNEILAVSAMDASTFTVNITKRSDGTRGTNQTVYWCTG
jgi:PKD repeat protein